MVNTFSAPGEKRDVRALNVNTLDEVPDSSWFQNRSRQSRSVADIVRGPDRLPSISLEGWMVSGGKSTGVQPGFRMTDPQGQLYQIEFDPPDNPEMASGAEIIGTAFYHAFGYHVVDVYLAELDPDRLVISEKATLWDPREARRRRLTRRELDKVLRRGARAGQRQVPGDRQPLRRGHAGRQLPLLRHAPGRSQRHRAARASPRTARRAGLRRVAEPRRLARRQQPRHAGDGGQPQVPQALHVRLRFDRSAAAPSTRSGIGPATSTSSNGSRAG